MTPARGDRFQLAPGGNAAAANPGSASCAQAARKRMPTRVTPQHCLVYAADHAAESAGVEDAAASSSSGGRQSDTKGGARLDAMPLASAGSRISHGGGWDEDGWQRGSSGSCNGRRWAGASGWLGKGVVGRKGDDRKALFQRQDSAEQLTSLPRRAVQLLATRSKSSVAKTCFSAGSLNLECKHPQRCEQRVVMMAVAQLSRLAMGVGEEAARTAGIQVSACAMMAVTVGERSTAGSGGGYPGNGGDCRTGSS